MQIAHNSAAIAARVAAWRASRGKRLASTRRTALVAAAETAARQGLTLPASAKQLFALAPTRHLAGR